MIKNYIMMKRNEWKIKATLFGIVATIIDNQKDILEIMQKMYSTFKDIPAEELKDEFISKMVEIIHEEK